MRIFKTLGLLLLVLLVFAQCKGKNGKVNMKKPEDVSLAFTRAFASFEFEKAKQYGSPETKELISLIESMMGAGGESELKRMKAETADAVKLLKSAKCNVSGEKAQCFVCCGPDGTASEQSLDLKQINGQWFVHLDKEAMMNQGGMD